MAINPNPDVRCTHPAHRELSPAAGFIRDTWTDIKSIWRPRCEEHIAELADDPDHDLVDVAYLDPTRQRRPDPDDYDRTAAAVKRTFTRPWPDYPDRP